MKVSFFKNRPCSYLAKRNQGNLKKRIEGKSEEKGGQGSLKKRISENVQEKKSGKSGGKHIREIWRKERNRWEQLRHLGPKNHYI